MRVVVIHTVNGATKTSVFDTPRPVLQFVAEGGRGAIAMTMRDERYQQQGFGLFTDAGQVALMGEATDQYFAVRAEETTDAI